ncbi:uncharacterized protein LOC142221227 [Haematobia irritans]|uniref:uncharacterized protein LOC142221227 n=1 Tax=Haematobia irritans TaxID=7368 RepID=UPI003F50CB6E
MVYSKVLTVLLIVAASSAQKSNDNSTQHTDDYIAANRRHYNDMIKDYDNQLQEFQAVYEARISTIDIQLNFLIETIHETDERLDTLEILSDHAEECVEKYKFTLPNENNTTAMIHNCSDNAMRQYNNLVAAPMETRKNLEDYYYGTFEKELSKCSNISSNMNNTQMNYTVCVTTVISEADTYAANNHKLFESQMDVAKCSADGYVKSALDCSYSAQNDALTMISGTNTIINNCIQGIASSTGYYCDYVERIPSSSVNSTNQTMPNPFYGRNETLGCLMLDIV